MSGSQQNTVGGSLYVFFFKIKTTETEIDSNARKNNILLIS
jgi:hypothetical protein